MGVAVYIICGGTGGHLSPGIATAQRLRDRGGETCLVVSDREVDNRLLQAYPELPCQRARGAPFRLHPVGLLRFLFLGMHSILEALRVLRRERPAVLLAFGGYLSVSWALAAVWLKIPLVLHEANRVPGRSIKQLAGMADRVYFPEGIGLRRVETKRRYFLGMPLRKEIRHIPKDVIRKKMEVPQHAKVLVIMGGSQGAQALNDWVERHRYSLAADGIWIYLVTGPGKLELPAREWARSDRGERVAMNAFAFHDAPHQLFSCADVVISRAGAGTLAELVESLAPAILVPYPHAADNHQLHNARYLEKRGGAVVLQQSEIDNLYREVLDLIFNDWLLSRMRRNLHSLRHGDEAGKLARDLEQVYIRKASRRGKKEVRQRYEPA
ncbi:MAG: UDP-N-acetylglucosamine--N-acetylmuramyl-(pentapeptide) pyrophosphoryl-undecaprenol N-acetylglucosamine transferase [Verrucomicrobia bacterium]|jgi:UDP-N-acetylglucosamine--N-acetylmuramyl-(pentapeptide) pyrophosphoryl-undecaprenol N-acetylglucosamine transferase|nr:UDP-N-acetylglucosamine--N-acetylmuramyl-(pentapeptide) pyrophosphoryl-undecaprenol N-acetylglucosamine transferase [Verrucomicrobiota bacterium]